jgi:hypothetical protein
MARIIAIKPDIENFFLLRRRFLGRAVQSHAMERPGHAGLRQGLNNEAFPATTVAGTGPKVEALCIEDIFDPYWLVSHQHSEARH